MWSNGKYRWTSRERPPKWKGWGGGEFKQEQRRRLRKRHLKSEFVLLQTLSHVSHLVQFVKCWQIFLELNSKENERRLVFASSTKREIRHFHVVVKVVQRRQKKREARAKLLFCKSKPITFLLFSLPLLSLLSLLKLPSSSKLSGGGLLRESNCKGPSRGEVRTHQICCHSCCL